MSVSIVTPSFKIPPLAITPEEPAAAAARMIVASRIGAVAVQDRTGRIVGLISEHDIVRVVATRAQGLRGLAVGEVMTPEPVAIRPGMPASDALDLMRRRDLRHLPVCCPDGKLLGVVGLDELTSPD
jgi:CBS domain-containing protein